MGGISKETMKTHRNAEKVSAVWVVKQVIYEVYLKNYGFLHGTIVGHKTFYNSIGYSNMWTNVEFAKYIGQSVLYHPGFIELFYPFTPYQHLIFPLNIDILDMDIIRGDKGY